MLQVQAAIAALLQLHGLLPLLVETENLDLAILPFLKSGWDQSMGCTCVHVLWSPHAGGHWDATEV